MRDIVTETLKIDGFSNIVAITAHKNIATTCSAQNRVFVALSDNVGIG